MRRSRRGPPKVESISKRSKEIEKCGVETKTPEPKVWPTIDRGGITERIVNHVGGEAENIVAELIGYAKEGNFQAMKYLFEMAGLFPAVAPAEPASRDTLTMRLRDRMEEFVREAKQKYERGEPGDAASVP